MRCTMMVSQYITVYDIKVGYDYMKLINMTVHRNEYIIKMENNCYTNIHAV